nr:ribosomal protein S3 [Incarvillea compacta]
MGQKINPLGFRLGTTQSHYSLWFAKPKNYSEGLQEDQKIRDLIQTYVQKNMKISSGTEGIARIEIQKSIDLIKVLIFMGFPKRLLESRPRAIKELEMNLQKEFHYGTQKLKITIKQIQKPYGNPTILAAFIATQIKNRVPFRKTIKKAIELTKGAGTKGIKVQIAGRLNGREQARVKWIREGRVPLQTIRAKIDYCSYPFRTIHGILGIKIWLFRDKEEE